MNSAKRRVTVKKAGPPRGESSTGGREDTTFPRGRWSKLEDERPVSPIPLWERVLEGGEGKGGTRNGGRTGEDRTAGREPVFPVTVRFRDEETRERRSNGGGGGKRQKKRNRSMKSGREGGSRWRTTSGIRRSLA